MPTTPASLVSQINDIYNPLLSGLAFDLNIPLELASIDLVTAPPSITLSPVPDIPVPTLTSLTAGDGTMTGTGAFDVIMKAVNKHLEAQFKKGTISQAESSKLYVQAIEVALAQAANFVIAAHSATWNGETVKRQAEMLEIQKASLTQEHSTKILETVTAKLNMSQTQINAHVAQGSLVATKIKVGDVYHDILAKEAQQELLVEQVDAARAQTKDTLRSGAAVGGMLLVEKSQKTKQLSLIDEQIDAARAQTKNTLVGGLIDVGGILGSQKALYDQQRQSYIHDSMNKAAKLLSDAWTTQKTVDDAWTPPNAFLNGYIDPALREYFETVGLATPT